MNEIKSDLMTVSIDEIRNEMGTEFTDLPDAIQVIDLYQEGFTLEEIVTAGYSRNDVKDAGFTAGEYESAKASADAAASESAAASANQKVSTSSTTIVIVVAALLVLLTIAGAAVYASKVRNGAAASSAPPQAFENPMYAESSSVQSPAYAGGGATAGYMDVNAGALNGLSNGYMDVNASPTGYADAPGENAFDDNQHAGDEDDDEDV